MKWCRYFRRIMALNAICLIPVTAMAQGVLDIYEYDSSLAWSAQTASLLEEVLDRVTRFLKPVEGRISSKFGARSHPILGVVKDHKGIDIACGAGSEVRAVFSGSVSYTGWKGGYGHLVALRHTGPFSESRYAHLSKILVQQGSFVHQGDIIGLSGESGLTTGPHLHFEIYKDGQVVDPEKFFDSIRRRPLPIFELFSQSSGGNTT